MFHVDLYPLLTLPGFFFVALLLFSFFSFFYFFLFSHIYLLPVYPIVIAVGVGLRRSDHNDRTTYLLPFLFIWTNARDPNLNSAVQ